MAKYEFEEVWEMLRQLENQSIDTLVHKNQNRFVRLMDSKVVRQIKTIDGKGWRDASDVSKASFRRIWYHLRRSGYYAGSGAFACACLVKLAKLGVELVEDMSPRTIVLKDWHSDSGIDTDMVTENEEMDGFGDPERIVVDPGICSGKPTIRGTRIMVANILGMFSGGYSINRVLKAYPQLSRLDVISALEYASWVVDREKIIARG